MTTKRLEKEIRKEITDYLKLMGFFVWWNLQGLGCYPGLPDLIAVKDGIHLCIEVKTKTGRISSNQKRFQEQIEKAGGHYIIARCYEDVKKGWEDATKEEG